MKPTRRALSLAAAVVLLASCGPKNSDSKAPAPVRATAEPAAAPGGAIGEAPISPAAAPAICTETAQFGHDCFTEKFPPDISHNSDIGCRFTISCCDVVVQRWEHAYPGAAGPSGVVSHATRDLEIHCDSPALADIDGDGMPNADDPDPGRTGSGLPWK